MNHLSATILLGAILLFGCNQAGNKTPAVAKTSVSASAEDKEQIRQLIRQALTWAHTDNSIAVLPVVVKDSVYTGVDLGRHQQGLVNLRQTDLFSAEFIENYNQIIKTLDRNIQNGTYEKWIVGDGPTFSFASEADPWTMCQDVPYDTPNPYEHVEISVVDLGKGEMRWQWGSLPLEADSDWKNFAYFRVVKENGKWKIDSMEGFDFKEGTRPTV